jgi:radical SAM protein with 4Fe4S-binding SPASM domain
MQEYLLKELKIEVTHQCPLACVHCSSDAFIHSKYSMDISDCLKIIKSASELGVEKIAFSGGEPLLWNNLNKCILNANKLNIKTIVYTCGNIKEFEEIFFKLVDSGLNEIVFSLYDGDPHKHDKITRINGSFNKTIVALEKAVKNNVIVKVHFVAMKSNYRQLEKVIEICKCCGVKSLSVLRFVPHGRGKMLHSALMNHNDYCILRDIIIKKNKTGMNIRTGSPLNFLLINENPECLAGIDRLVIGPDLNIYPCDAFKGYSSKYFFTNDWFSNLSKKSLKECWEKSKYLNLIRSHIDNYGDTCLKCTAFNSCRSGCLAQKNIVYGDFIGRPDPSCLMNIKEQK